MAGFERWIGDDRDSNLQKQPYRHPDEGDGSPCEAVSSQNRPEWPAEQLPLVSATARKGCDPSPPQPCGFKFWA